MKIEDFRKLEIKRSQVVASIEALGLDPGDVISLEMEHGRVSVKFCGRDPEGLVLATRDGYIQLQACYIITED